MKVSCREHGCQMSPRSAWGRCWEGSIYTLWTDERLLLQGINKLTANRTPVARSSRPAATRAVNVPMKPCPARCVVPEGSKLFDPLFSYTDEDKMINLRIGACNMYLPAR